MDRVANERVKSGSETAVKWLWIQRKAAWKSSRGLYIWTKTVATLMYKKEVEIKARITGELVKIMIGTQSKSGKGNLNLSRLRVTEDEDEVVWT